MKFIDRMKPFAGLYAVLIGLPENKREKVLDELEEYIDEVVNQELYKDVRQGSE